MATRTVEVMSVTRNVAYVPTPRLNIPLEYAQQKDCRLLAELFNETAWKVVHDQYVAFHEVHGLVLWAQPKYKGPCRYLDVRPLASAKTPAYILAGGMMQFAAELSHLVIEEFWRNRKREHVVARRSTCQQILLACDEESYLLAAQEYMDVIQWPRTKHLVGPPVQGQKAKLLLFEGGVEDDADTDAAEAEDGE